MKAPLISIIMPVRNVDQYVHFSVNSILKQSFEDFEFIIIDDASTDDTRQLLDEINDRRIIRINNKKQTGNYKCRNQGLNIAKGKYIVVMDGDDIAYSERLHTQYHFMETNTEYLATGSDIEFFFENSYLSLSQKLRDSEKIKVWLLKDNVCTHPTLMIRKKVFDFYKIRYNENYYYSSDYNLMLDINQIGSITNIAKPLLRYRIHRDQISSSKKQEQIMYADYIRLKQLAFLKMRPTPEEIMVHLSLMKDGYIPESKLILAEKWCNKLLSKNQKLNIYHKEYLYSLLEERFRNAFLKCQND